MERHGDGDQVPLRHPARGAYRADGDVRRAGSVDQRRVDGDALVPQTGRLAYGVALGGAAVAYQHDAPPGVRGKDGAAEPYRSREVGV